MLSSTVRRGSKAAVGLLRGLRTSAASRGGAHEPDYVHAKHMYDVQGMTNRKLKWGLTAVGMVGGGSAVVAIAINHQQKKAAG